MTAIKMSLRLFATLTLLLGLVMWIFSLDHTVLVPIHILCAVLVLVLSVVVLFLPATVKGNNSTVRMFQRLTLLSVAITMIIGSLQLNSELIVIRIIHLILAVITVGLVEMTLARQNRIARAARAEASVQ